MGNTNPVAIVGAGPEGGAFAVHLLDQGRDVLLYGHRQHSGLTEKIEERGGKLVAGGMVAGPYTVKVTSRMSDVVRFSPYIIITVPAAAHDNILAELADFDLRGHKLLVTPGNFFGRYARKKKKLLAQFIFETSTAPYAAKMEGETLLVKDAKHDLEIGVLPNDASDDLRAEIESLLPRKPKWYGNTLVIGLANVGTVVHVLTALMTAVKDRDFYFYRGGAASPPVRDAILRLDWARLVIVKAYDEVLPEVTDAVEAFYRQGYKTFQDFAEKSKPHNMTKGTPVDIREHRYLTEDVPYVLVTWYELGCARRKAPQMAEALRIIRTVIDMAWMATGVDYMRTGRKLRDFGLHKAPKGRILAAFGEKRSALSKVLDTLSEPLMRLRLI